MFYDVAAPHAAGRPACRATRPSLRNPNRRDPIIVEDYDNLQAGDIAVALSGSTLITASFAGAPACPAHQRRVHPAQPGQPQVYPLVRPDYIGDETLPLDQRTGLAALATIDEMSLLCVPNEVDRSHRQHHRRVAHPVRAAEGPFAVLQVPARPVATREHLPALSSSTYVAIYYPWIRVVDPITQATMLVPPGGHVAGIYAATDEARGVHKAPANVEVAGILINDLPGNHKPLEYTSPRAIRRS